MTEIYVTFISMVSLLIVTGILLWAAILLFLPTGAALLMKPSERNEEYLLIKSKGYDYDEDR